MRRERTALLFGIAVAMTLWFAAALLWRSGRDREPSSRGKTVTPWLDTMQLVPGQFDLATDPAIAAIKALGTNAIPTLVSHIASPSKESREVEVYDGFKDKMGDVASSFRFIGSKDQKLIADFL